jgi:hypothetical protein
MKGGLWVITIFSWQYFIGLLIWLTIGNIGYYIFKNRKKKTGRQWNQVDEAFGFAIITLGPIGLGLTLTFIDCADCR